MADRELSPREGISLLDEVENTIRQREARRAALVSLTDEELDKAEADAKAEQESLYVSPPDSMDLGSGIVEPEDLPYFAQLNEDLADIELARITRSVDGALKEL